MQTKSIFTAITCLLFSFIATAQTHNPYKDIGKKGKVLTLTNGEYDEFFDEDSIQRIGSALVNINTMKVVKVQLTKEEQRQLDNSQVSRFLSVDPLTQKYAMLTPYQFASNTPIQAIDLDGLEGFVPTGINGYGMIISVEDAAAIVKKVKVEAFKFVFTEELPKKLINHYAYCTGSPYKLTKKEMEDVRTTPTGIHGGTPNDIKKTSDLIAGIKRGSSQELPEGYSISVGSNNAGTLGRFKINLKGTITKEKDNDKWSFKGKMQFEDIYDFITTPTEAGGLGRPDDHWADVQTDFAQKYLPGVGFSVTSDWVDVTQDNKNYLDWFDGKNSTPVENKVTKSTNKTAEVKKTANEVQSKKKK